MQQMQQREISNYANRYFFLYRNFGGPWACCDCDCTEKLEQRLASQGERFWNRYVRASCDRKHETPSTREIPNSKPPKTWKVIGWSLKIGACVGIWSLTQHIYIS